MAIKNAADTELPIPIADGGTGQITQQAALDAITDVASATTGQVLTKDGSGNAVFQSPLEGGEQLLYFTATTTDATETTLGSVAVPADKAITFTIIVSAKGPSNKHYWAKIDGGARRNTAENAALVGVPANTNDDENTPGYSATVDVNGNDLRIRVTGASAENVVWDAKILYSSDSAGEDLISSKSILVFDTITTDATESTLATIAVPDLTNVSYWALVTAHLDNTGVDKNYWAVIEGGVRRNNGGNATLVGTRQIIEDDEGTPGYIADVDVSGTSLRIRVTGASSETVNWKCKVILVSDNVSEQLIDFLPVRDNNTYLQWRNTGNSADINALKIDASDSLVFYDKWAINSSGTLNGLNLASNDNNTIAVPTTDGSDHARLVLCGAGTSSSSRGAAFYAHGNEHPSFPGSALIQAGAPNGVIEFYTNASKVWEINASGDLLPNADNTYDIGSASLTLGRIYTNGVQANGSLNLTLSAPGANEVQFFTNATQRWKVDSSGDFIPSSTSGIYDIGTTSNYIGNTHTVTVGSPGDLTVFASGASGDILFQTNGSFRWQIYPGGTLEPKANNAYDVGSASLRVRTFYAVNALNTSDQRLKTNISSIDITTALTKVNSLNPITFQFEPNYDDGEARLRSGFKAQEVQTHIPEAVVAGDADGNKVFGDEGFESWSMQTDHIIPYLVAAIQKLSERIDALENP